MPNLVGIGNSQVPTNAMLGGLAYQDSVGEIAIDKIKARIFDNALDIFVYDTRKDSDGGAWRHRTQNKSWYNEGASATRGARKEFPAVAVIVAEEESVSIYDGDDPNLPSWMKFNAGSGGDKIFNRPTAWDITAVFALNGIVCITNGANSAESTLVLNYVNDSARLYPISGYPAYGGDYTLGISGRSNSSGSFITISQNIVGDETSDVAMTVLPNATIDASTGLPVPTIAVGTEHGVSVIKDDNTIISTSTGTSIIHKVEFTDDHGLNAVISNTSGTNLACVYVNDIDKLNGLGYGTYNNWDGVVYKSKYDPKALTYKTASTNDTISGFIDLENRSSAISVQATGGGLTLFEKSPKEPFDPDDGMVAFITTDYNTGWMHGDIKGAFLSDTDDTNITGTSLIANGDFSSSSTAAFTTVAGGTAEVVGGLLKLTDTEGAFCYASAPFTTVVGDQYYVTVDIVNNSNTAPSNYIRCGNAHNGTQFHNVNYGTGYGTKTFYFTATTTTTYLTLISGHGVGNPFGHWDNVFVYKLDNDRSNNATGIRPYGTIEKHAVATGAELVGYRPDSSSQGTNYFQLPLTSSIFDLTGDWSITFWAKNNGNTAANYSGFEISPDDISSNNAYSLIPLSMYIQGNGFIGLRGMNGNANHDATGYPLSIVGDWRCFHIVHRSGTTYLYIDGELETSKSVTYTNPASAYSLYIFRWTYSTTRHDGRRHIDFSLFRMSETALTEEQVKKMYYDERCLFHENAKCTLHGTSDVVKAIAYDDTNDVLHVGTSSGRSEFQGLNRINNTTTAVTTAISASNEFVAEQ